MRHAHEADRWKHVNTCKNRCTCKHNGFGIWKTENIRNIKNIKIGKNGEGG